MVCCLAETRCILILFIFCIDHHNLHGPVSKRKAGNATVSARSVDNIVSEIGLKEVSRITPDDLRVVTRDKEGE